jgi:hypothetical protein
MKIRIKSKFYYPGVSTSGLIFVPENKISSGNMVSEYKTEKNEGEIFIPSSSLKKTFTMKVYFGEKLIYLVMLIAAIFISPIVFAMLSGYISLYYFFSTRLILSTTEGNVWLGFSSSRELQSFQRNLNNEFKHTKTFFS